MTVNLSKLLPGDTIVLRNGEKHVVTTSNEDPYAIALKYNISTLNQRTGSKESWKEFVWRHRFTGELGHSDGTWPGDIVQVIPQQQEEPDLEVDKSNLYVSRTGAKRYSLGKTPYQYLPLDLLDGAARVMEHGAAKYGAENFRLGFDPEDALASLMRHVATLQRAVMTDDREGSGGYLLDESGEAHVHHVITSALILIDSMRKKGYKV